MNVENNFSIPAESDIEAQVPPHSPVLSASAEGVTTAEIHSPDVQNLIDKMYRVAAGRQGDAQIRTLVGLAAPQLGISKRIVLIGMNAVGAGEQPELREFINPVISEPSDVKVEGREGCFSTGRVCGIVARAEAVTVSAVDRKGESFTVRLQGFPARVAQHEVDHLDGIRFPDRIEDDSKLHWVEAEEFGEYRLYWATWPHHCSRQTWEAIKRGD